jgi:hypothetical protein
MTSLSYVEITGTFDSGSGSPMTGTVTFTPSQSVYASGVPVASADQPVTVDITDGALGAVELLSTANDDLTFLDSLTGFFFWTVEVSYGENQDEPPWSFFLPSSPDSVDLYSLANTGAGGGGGIVDSVTAGDASIVVGGTDANPTVETGTLDEIASLHAPAANWSNNGKKITDIENGSAASDAAAYGQIPTTATEVGALPSTDDLSAIATANATAANVPMNSHKLTGLPAGSASGDSVAFQQLPSSGSPLPLAEGGTGLSESTAAALVAALGALLGTNNLSDLVSAATARTNLGLGSAATQNSSAFDTSGAAATAQSNAETYAAAQAATAQSNAEAYAMPKAGGTYTGAVVPSVAALTDGASIAVNAALGNVFTVTIAGDRTLANPSNVTTGQHLLFAVTQDGTGSRTLAYGGNYDFGSAGTPALSTAAGDTDVLAFLALSASKLAYLGIATGN